MWESAIFTDKQVVSTSFFILGSPLEMKKMILLLTIFFAVNGCDGWEFFETPVHANLKPAQTKSIKIGTVQQALNGFELELLQSFLREYNIPFQIKNFTSTQSLIESADNENIDILAARLIGGDWSNLHDFSASTSYDEQKLFLGCNADSKTNDPKTIYVRFDQLSKSERAEIKDQNKPAKFVFLNELNFKKINQIKSENNSCILVDEIFYKMISPLFPEIKYKELNLTKTFHLFFNNHFSTSEEINSLFTRWLQSAIRQGRLNEIRYNYFGHYENTSNMDYWDFRIFQKRINSRWPTLKKLVLKNSKEFKIPWQTIAAISFKESQWEPLAESHKGAMGLMQLTWPTAQHLGVDDPFDSNQSLWGGTKYIKQLMNTFDDSFSERNRFIFSLMAYNMGYAHLVDAMQLSENFDMKPNQWVNLKKILPLLKLENIKPQLKYGSANGFETLYFVDGILTYLDWLDFIPVEMSEPDSKSKKTNALTKTSRKQHLHYERK